MSEAKLLTPQEVREHTQDVSDAGLPLHAEALRAHIAALEADNAALLAWIDEWGHATWCEREHDKALHCSEQCNAGPMLHDPHPGATLLEEHRRALEEGRAERDRLHAALLEEARWAVLGRAAVKALEQYAKPEGEDFEACLKRALTRARNEGLETARKMVANVGLANLASLIGAAKERT